MLEAYSGRLIGPDFQNYHDPFRKAVIPPTDENNYQIAERYLREALPVFRLHYKEDNSAIFANECNLAYALAMQEKWTDFDEHYSICKQGEEKLKGTDLSKGIKTRLALIEKTLVEKNKLK